MGHGNAHSGRMSRMHPVNLTQVVLNLFSLSPDLKTKTPQTNNTTKKLNKQKPTTNQQQQKKTNNKKTTAEKQPSPHQKNNQKNPNNQQQNKPPQTKMKQKQQNQTNQNKGTLPPPKKKKTKPTTTKTRNSNNNKSKKPTKITTIKLLTSCICALFTGMGGKPKSTSQPLCRRKGKVLHLMNLLCTLHRGLCQIPCAAVLGRAFIFVLLL